MGRGGDLFAWISFPVCCWGFRLVSSRLFLDVSCTITRFIESIVVCKRRAKLEVKVITHSLARGRLCFWLLACVQCTNVRGRIKGDPEIVLNAVKGLWRLRTSKIVTVAGTNGCRRVPIHTILNSRSLSTGCTSGNFDES